MTSPTVLVTGAAGRVAGQLLAGLDDVRLRLLDRRRPEEPSGAQVLVGELTDRDLLARAVDGVDAVVHLAGEPNPDADWADLEAPNVDGFVALLGAAQEHGVRRVVYASSVHAMGRYEAEGRYPIDPTWAPAPCCPYGATKAFDEAIAGVFAHRHGVSTIGLRLGATEPEPFAARQLPGWLGPADLRQLVLRAIEADVRTGMYSAVSANSGGRWSLGTARADLGYQPVLDSADWADRVEDDGAGLTTCRHP
ncbi:NAD(P)-dependent oxidoreductase [uncultured Cellulomonas sp.]|uniref:NAD-dependent epimerase/dehydratase family protein n=1 Tax=uncultured Cellulomonas sp. TaxID=189682 RepID=UPI002634DF28|nr:NAD(P)-dependent oxidoreductase [uncultured Cellulomonas sp.]